MGDSPQPGGWIKVYRSLEQNGHLHMPHLAFKVLMYLMLRVNSFPASGCQPGEGWITYDMIRERCSDMSQGIMPNSSITRALGYLEGSNPDGERYIERISVKRGGPQRIRILNWDKYQGESSIEVIQPPIQPKIQPAIHKQEGREGKEDTLPPPSAEAPQETAKRRQRQPPKEKAPKAEKAPDPYNVAAQPLVQRLDAWLKAHDTAGVGEWPAAVKMVANALKGKGGPPIPAEEAEQALIWGAKDARYRQRLLTIGALALREVWAAWKNGGAPAYSNNRYQDHTKIQPTGKSMFEN